MWLVHIVQRPTATGQIGRRNLSTVGKNCKRAKKVQGNYVPCFKKKACCKKLQVQKKEIVYPARKSVSAEIALALDTLILNPSFLPSTRAKRVHYVSVKVKLTKAKMTNLKNF